MSRMDIITGRKGRDGKTYWTKIGSAWPSEKGGYQLSFDALPITDGEGRCSALLVEPKPRDDQPQERGGKKERQADIDDSIPF